MADKNADRKRGRLSSIDLLPEEAWPHVKLALAALAENKREAESIREELNLHLSGIDGCQPISRSAFNRKSLQLAKIGMDISRAREMAAVFAEKVNDMPEGDVGMLINEMCKVIIYNMTAEASAMDMEASAKMMKEVSLAVYRLEQAGAISVKRRSLIVDRAKAEAGEAVKTVAKAKGLTGDVVNSILDQILGKPERVENPESKSP
jgi:Protein of unknown function (DUF3486)